MNIWQKLMNESTYTSSTARVVPLTLDKLLTIKEDLEKQQGEIVTAVLLSKKVKVGTFSSMPAPPVMLKSRSIGWSTYLANKPSGKWLIMNPDDFGRIKTKLWETGAPEAQLFSSIPVIEAEI